MRFCCRAKNCRGHKHKQRWQTDVLEQPFIDSAHLFPPSLKFQTKPHDVLLGVRTEGVYHQSIVQSSDTGRRMVILWWIGSVCLGHPPHPGTNSMENSLGLNFLQSSSMTVIRHVLRSALSSPVRDSPSVKLNVIKSLESSATELCVTYFLPLQNSKLIHTRIAKTQGIVKATKQGYNPYRF